MEHIPFLKKTKNEICIVYNLQSLFIKANVQLQNIKRKNYLAVMLYDLNRLYESTVLAW